MDKVGEFSPIFQFLIYIELGPEYIGNCKISVWVSTLNLYITMAIFEPSSINDNCKVVGVVCRVSGGPCSTHNSVCL